VNLRFENALVLAPHTDDGELGCGGTIARLIDAGAAVYYVAYSICEESVPDHLPADILATEVQQATRTLGITAEQLTVHRYPVRKFPEYRQAILEQMVELRRHIDPQLVMLPSTDDVHQDHQVIQQEGMRAFKQTTILGYELPWNNLRFAATAHVALQSTHLQRKIAALQAYDSQRQRTYTTERYITSLAAVRGQQIGQAWAEAFEVIRWVIA